MTPQPPNPLARVAVVAIGRNEGPRLERALKALPLEPAIATRAIAGAVYVDSGSTDGSVALAASLGVHAVGLDTSVPFTAARARNAGLDRVRQLFPRAAYLQFIDGDCELVPGFLERAAAELDRDPAAAAVCGTRAERHPDATPYNALADLEWQGPAGDVKACGGDAMFRLEALDRVGGYDPAVVAGEEPELCFRLRAHGWTVRRIDGTMTLHDADIKTFAQWWKRCVRAGHAAAQGYAMHGRASAERYNLDRVTRPIVWALVIPLAAIAAAAASAFVEPRLAPLPVAAALALYAAQWLRMLARERRAGRPPKLARLRATWFILDKFAQLQGIATYLARRARGRAPTIIEYKAPAGARTDTHTPAGEAAA